MTETVQFSKKENQRKRTEGRSRSGVSPPTTTPVNVGV